MTPSSSSVHVRSRLQLSRCGATVASILVVVLSVSLTDVTHAAPSKAISSKKLQGIWKVVKIDLYNPETKTFEDHTMDSDIQSGMQYFLFQKNQLCASSSLPKGHCDDSPFEPFSLKRNIITLGKGEQPPNNSAAITLKGGKLILLILPDKASRLTLKRVKKKKDTAALPTNIVPPPPVTVAVKQDWVFDAVMQPVPRGASHTRLATLPAPPEKILLRHLGAFGSHQGGHPEGLDHEWIDIEEGTPVGSWADGKVIEVRRSRRDDPSSDWRIIIDYGDGLFGEHMDVQTPLVQAGDTVKAGQPVALGVPVPWTSGRHSGEFSLTDEHRRDGVQSWVRQQGVLVSPYDYLRDDVKRAFIDIFTREVLEPFVATGDTTGGVKPWEPYLTNPMLFHTMYRGTLAGEWMLKSKKWAVDEIPDLIMFFTNNTKYYNKKRVLANEDEAASPIFSGTWETDDNTKQFTIKTEEGGMYYGIFELDESGPRATLKMEYQTGSHPTQFSGNAQIYIERDSVGRRQDGYNLGVRDTLY